METTADKLKASIVKHGITDEEIGRHIKASGNRGALEEHMRLLNSEGIATVAVGVAVVDLIVEKTTSENSN